jgi:integrase
MARNAGKRVKEPKRSPAHRYTRLSCLAAITRACDRAFPPTGELALREKESAAKWWARLTRGQQAAVKAWRREHHWHPNQLRHSFATRVRKAHGLEAAQVLLGHARANVTQVYAERNEELAARVAAQGGGERRRGGTRGEAPHSPVA